jgi:hypothetical protein
MGKKSGTALSGIANGNGAAENGPMAGAKHARQSHLDEIQSHQDKEDDMARSACVKKNGDFF